MSLGPTAAGDTIFGTTGADVLRGMTGNDAIDGLAGNDKLFGDAGNDKLTDRLGKDTFNGGPGNDTIDAVDKPRGTKRNRDTITCGKGRDTVRANRNEKSPAIPKRSSASAECSGGSRCRGPPWGALRSELLPAKKANFAM